jgi:hypothetical protein
LLIRIGPPQCSASVLSPRDFRRLCFSLAIRALVPAVPRKSLHPTHAPSTPVAVCPVIRHLTDFSQKGFTFLVLTTLSFLTTRLRWVHFRSSFGCPPAQGLALSFCSNAHHHGSLPQQLGVVCDLLLKAGPEGPALIFHAASRRSLLLCVALLSICLCSTLSPRKLSVAIWSRVWSRCFMPTPMATGPANRRSMPCTKLVSAAGVAFVTKFTITCCN